MRAQVEGREKTNTAVNENTIKKTACYKKVKQYIQAW